MAGHRTLDPGMVVRAHRGQSSPKKTGRGGLTPARAAFSQPAPYGLGWSGFVSFASLTSRSAARSASFASVADRPRFWSVLPMLLPLLKPARMFGTVMLEFLLPRF